MGYGYANIGQLFALAEIAACAEELEDYLSTIPREKNIYASHLKYKQSDVSLMPKKTKELVVYLNSPEFIHILQNITGIQNLAGDPDFFPLTYSW